MCTFYTDASLGKIDALILKKLQEINNQYSKTKNHAEYTRQISLLFNLKSLTQLTHTQKVYLAGFVEGEGSINVGAKKTKSAALGLCIDPEFSITQSIFGVNHLYNALVLFKTGRISSYSGSNATLVFRIDNRTSLKEVVIPFYNDFVRPSSSNNQRLDWFIELLKKFDEGQHLQLSTMNSIILPLWDKMRMQKGQKNETFSSLEDAKQYVINFVKEKN